MISNSCWPFCLSRKPASPHACSQVSQMPPEHTSESTADISSVDEKTPRKVVNTTRSVFQQHGRSPSRDLVLPRSPAGIVSMPAITNLDPQPLEDGGANNVTVFSSPHEHSLRRYGPINANKFKETGQFMLEPSAYQEKVKPELPGALQQSQLESLNQERTFQISKVSRQDRLAEAKEKEILDNEEASSSAMASLILNEQRPGSVIPEDERRTRLVYGDDDRQIYAISYPDSPEKTVYFDLTNLTFTPTIHGVAKIDDI